MIESSNIRNEFRKEECSGMNPANGRSTRRWQRQSHEKSKGMEEEARAAARLRVRVLAGRPFLQ